jgi:hypothetical protein
MSEFWQAAMTFGQSVKQRWTWRLMFDLVDPGASFDEPLTAFMTADGGDLQEFGEFDPVDGGGIESVDADDDAINDVLIFYLGGGVYGSTSPDYLDRGVEGLDLVDLIDGMLCRDLRPPYLKYCRTAAGPYAVVHDSSPLISAARAGGAPPSYGCALLTSTRRGKGAMPASRSAARCCVSWISSGSSTPLANTSLGSDARRTSTCLSSASSRTAARSIALHSVVKYCLSLRRCIAARRM